MWQKYLKNHPALEKLKSNILPRENGLKQLVQNQADSILIWDDVNGCIYSINLKALNNGIKDYQTLNFTGAISHEIRELLLNPSETMVALLGKQHISVVVLPQRWGKEGLFEGGKSNVSCRQLNIADIFISCNGNIEIMKALWHPGSPTDTHIAVLTSDNYLRIYNVEDGMIPQVAISLGSTTFNTYLPNSKLSFLAALGETAVSFDFGKPNHLETDKHESKTRSSMISVKWPVYILFGNGEIYFVRLNLDSDNKPVVHGPLLMYPESEDNYGVDACSILCLQATVPVLIIGTSKGKLYHGIMLEDADQDDNFMLVRSWSETEKLGDKEVNMSLFMYESVELDINMTFDEETLDKEVCSNLMLQRDPLTPSRYFCSHIAGLHVISVPIVNHIEDFIKRSQGELNPLESEHECVVEHILCTQPSASSSPSPLLGTTFITSPTLGPTTLVLLSSFDFISFHLNIFTCLNPPLLSEECDEINYPLKQIHKESFDMHIKKLLLRNTSQPLIQTSESVSLDPKSCLELLNKATHVYREEYLHKFDLAHEELIRRVKILIIQKKQQTKDVSSLSADSSILRDNNKVLRDKTESISAKQIQLLHRVEKVLDYVQKHLPIMSQAEREMKEELQKTESKLKILSNTLEQVRVKENYQERIMVEFNKSIPILQNASEDLPSSQVEALKEVLVNQSVKVADLMKTVNASKIAMGI